MVDGFDNARHCHWQESPVKPGGWQRRATIREGDQKLKNPVLENTACFIR
jgi:hypothetical protein